MKFRLTLDLGRKQMSFEHGSAASLFLVLRFPKVQAHVRKKEQKTFFDCAVKPAPNRFRILVWAALFVASLGFKLDAALYVSNLTNRFDGGGIGIGSSLSPGQGYFLGSFTTGAGSYSLNSVVLEFDAVIYGPDSWTNILVDLYQVIGNQPLPIVPLGRPMTNSMPTQWPQNTAFIDFHPNWQTSLQPFTQYQIAIRVPVESPRPAALLFCVVTNYASLAGWQMGPGLLKLAVDATLLEEQFTYATNNGALTIVRYVGAGGDVSIPDTIYGMPVVSIGQGAFGNSSNLVSITVPGSVTSIGASAFADCSSLTSVYFRGNVPTSGSLVFENVDNATVYYLPGTTGWSTNFAGRPALLWNPLAITDDGVFGVRSNQFGFNITGTPSIPVLVESTTNLAQGGWLPLQTITLTNGLFYFQDSNWTNYPTRIYRLRSP